MTNFLLYGGAFDPPHIGHIKAITNGIQKANKILPYNEEIDEIWIIPDDQKFFNDNRELAPFVDRVGMLRLILEFHNIKNFRFRFESKNKTIPKGLFYILRRLIDDDSNILNNKYFFLMGEDQAESFKNWIAHEKYNELPITFIIVKRSYGISSTDIRKNLKYENSHPYGLINSVLSYIRRNNLYA